MPKDQQNQQAEEQTDTEKKLLFLPYIKGVSEKIERICFLLQVTPIFKSMNTLRQSTDEGEVKQTGQCEESCGLRYPLCICIHWWDWVAHCRWEWKNTNNMLGGHTQDTRGDNYRISLFSMDQLEDSFLYMKICFIAYRTLYLPSCGLKKLAV